MSSKSGFLLIIMLQMDYLLQNLGLFASVSSAVRGFARHVTKFGTVDATSSGKSRVSSQHQSISEINYNSFSRVFIYGICGPIVRGMDPSGNISELERPTQ